MADIEALKKAGGEVILIAPDEASTATTRYGALDPAWRKPAAEAGRAQGERIAKSLQSAMANCGAARSLSP
jgi:NTE family protein